MWCWFNSNRRIIDKIYRFTSYDQTTFESIKDNLLDRLGGEILIRYENNKRYLDYVLQAGKKSSVDIRLSKIVSKSSGVIKIHLSSAFNVHLIFFIGYFEE